MVVMSTPSCLDAVSRWGGLERLKSYVHTIDFNYCYKQICVLARGQVSTGRQKPSSRPFNRTNPSCNNIHMQGWQKDNIPFLGCLSARGGKAERRRRWKRGGALRNERAIFCSRSVARCKRSARTLRAVESTDSNGPVSLQQRTAC